MGVFKSEPKPFAPQQVWASAFGIGAIFYIYCNTRYGISFLGANLEMVTNNPEVVNNVIGPI